VRITGQVKGDGDPSCFSNVEDTGIPALRQWCHQLTISSRSRAAKQFHTHLKTFANSVRAYVDGIGDVTVADREALREKWESTPQGGQDPHDDDDSESFDPFDDSHPFFNRPGWLDSADARLFTINSNSSLKVDARGEPIGVTPRLVKVRPLELTSVFCTTHISFSLRNSEHMLRHVSRICKPYSVMVLRINVKWAQPM